MNEVAGYFSYYSSVLLFLLVFCFSCSPLLYLVSLICWRLKSWLSHSLQQQSEQAVNVQCLFSHCWIFQISCFLKQAQPWGLAQLEWKCGWLTLRLYLSNSGSLICCICDWRWNVILNSLTMLFIYIFVCACVYACTHFLLLTPYVTFFVLVEALVQLCSKLENWSGWKVIF